MRMLAIASTCALLAACGENLTEPGSSRDLPLACLPDLDGKIEAAELAPQLGASVRYLASKDRTVNLAGAGAATGPRAWDFSTSLAGEQTLELAARRLGAEWYAASFPTGQFVVPSDAAATLEGVYLHDDRGLWLLGLASASENPPEGKTLLVYRDPVPVLRFPLENGARWTATGDLPAATIRGLPYVGKDVYDVTIDAEGEVALPDVIFTRALRVRTRVTTMPAIGPAVVRRQASFFFECFGEVARATSRDGESADDFTTAAEFRRVTF